MSQVKIKSADFDFRYEGRPGLEGLCKLAERMGYNGIPQLATRNGSYVSSLCDMLEDNPGAVEALVNWIADFYREDIEANDAAEDEAEYDQYTDSD